jgi:predicted MFS family arabinose efflux permease
MTATDRRLGFAIVAAAFAIVMAGTTLPTPLYPIYQHELGFSGLTITIIFATYAAGVITALILFGNLSDQIGRKRTLLPGLVAAAASAVVFLLAHGLAPLLLARFLSGVSAGIFTGTATATLMDLAPRGGGDRAALVATLVNMGGLGLGPLFAGLLAEVAPDPLRLVFVVHLVLVVAVGIALALGVPEPGTVGPLRIRPRGLEVPLEVRPAFVRAAIAGFAGFAVMGLFTAVAPAFLGQVLGVTNHAAVGVVVFVIFLASVAGQLGRRAVSDRAALAGGCFGLIAGMALLVAGLRSETLSLVIAAAIVAGAGQGLSFAAGLAMVAGGAPADRRAATTSSLFVVTYVAISLPVIGVGLLAQATDLKVAGTVFGAAVAVLAATAAATLVRDR